MKYSFIYFRASLCLLKPNVTFYLMLFSNKVFVRKRIKYNYGNSNPVTLTEEKWALISQHYITNKGIFPEIHQLVNLLDHETKTDPHRSEHLKPS